MYPLLPSYPNRSAGTISGLTALKAGRRLAKERLTFHYSGRDFRLTDVQGKVVENIML
jgi:hypothetical protein